MSPKVMQRKIFIPFSKLSLNISCICVAIAKYKAAKSFALI